MSSNRHIKDPSAIKDYKYDWGTNWLAAGETISSATVTVPAGLTKVSQSNTTTTVTVRLSGGTAGPTWIPVVCHITTNQGQEDDRTIYIKVQDV